MVVESNLKLTSSKRKSYDSHARTVDVAYLKAARGIATLKTEDIAKSFPGN
jgi:hypothetical protein